MEGIVVEVDMTEDLTMETVVGVTMIVEDMVEVVEVDMVAKEGLFTEQFLLQPTVSVSFIIKLKMLFYAS